MLAELLLRWPLIRQLRGKSDGTGADAMSDATRALRKKNDGASVARSVCPYCAVGCGQLVYASRRSRDQHRRRSGVADLARASLSRRARPVSSWSRIPGATTKVKYRAPRSREWVELDLERAMDMVADRVWTTRERTFDERHMHTTGIAHLGGATLDIEENYLIKKLFTAGLGMVCLSNQARI